MGFPDTARRHRAQAYGPVGAAGAGRTDDIEFDAAAQRMPLQGVEDPGPELVERRRSFAKNASKSMSHPLFGLSPGHGGGLCCGAIVGAGVVNSSLKPADRVPAAARSTSEMARQL